MLVLPFSSARLFATALLVAALACSDSTEPAPTPVAQIVVAGLPDSVGLGDQLTLQASARAGDGGALGDAAISWRSLAPAIATVTPAGVASAVGSGDAPLVVTASLRGSREDTVVMRVRVLPRRIAWTIARDSVLVHDTIRVAAAAQDGLGRPMTTAVTIAVADTSRAIVDAQGLVKPRYFGTVWLRATAGDYVDSTALRIVMPALASSPLWPATIWSDVAPSGFDSQWFSYCAVDAAGLLSCGGGAPTSMGTTPLRSFSNGYRQACGLAADSTAYCVGSNAEGEFGLGAAGVLTTPSSNALVPSGGGRKWRQLEVGDNRAACGIQAADSVVYCWGLNDNGQVGRLPASRSAPEVLPFATPLKAKKVELGYFSGCAIALDDSLWCWGEPIAFLGGFPDVVPTQVAPAGSYVDVIIGGIGFTTCALEADGSAWCWGEDLEAVGVGQTYTRRRVVSTVPFVRLVGATSASQRSCGLTADGALWCFSRVPGRESLVALPLLPNARFRRVRVGFFATCGVTTDDRSICF